MAAQRTPGTGFLARFFAKLAKLTGSTRVLQIEELRAAASETIDLEGLRGLKKRYLPSRISLAVSPEDHAFLSPFLTHITDSVSSEFVQRIHSGEWIPTSRTPEILLEINEALAPGGAPVLSLGYPEGKMTSAWKPTHASVHKEPEGKTGFYSLIITSGEEEYTAAQEKLLVYLAPAIPARALDPSAEPDCMLRLEDGEVRIEKGARWYPPAGMALEILGPTAGDRSSPREVDILWLRCPDHPGGALIWCPEGTAVFGREEGLAQLVPEAGIPLLSRRQFRLRHENEKELSITDLGSMNGTRVEGHRLEAGRAKRIVAPARVEIGEKGSVVIEILPGRII